MYFDAFLMFLGPGDKSEPESPEKYPSATGAEEVTGVQGEFFTGSTLYTCTGPVGRLPGVRHLGEWGEPRALPLGCSGDLGKRGLKQNSSRLLQ